MASAHASTRILVFVVLALLVVAIVALRFRYGRKRPTVNAVIARVVKIPRAHRRGSLVTGLCAVIVVVGVLYARSPQPTRAPSLALVFNPVLDPGTALSRPAPNFVLTDQLGHNISLRSFQGKVVILGFNDSSQGCF